MKKNKGLILSSAAAVLAPVALVAQPVLAENVWSNPQAVASSERWSGLKSAKDGGPNVAYVDKAGLSATEVAEIKQLPVDAKAKGCTLYKLVYEKDGQATTTANGSSNGLTSNLPEPAKQFVDKVLPNTGDAQVTTVVGTLVGVGLLSGAAFMLIKGRKGRAALIVLLASGATLGFGISAGAYTGNDIAPSVLVADESTLTAPEIKGYHFVGYLELQGACLLQETPKTTEDKPVETPKKDEPKAETPKTEEPKKTEEKPKEEPKVEEPKKDDTTDAKKDTPDDKPKEEPKVEEPVVTDKPTDAPVLEKPEGHATIYVDENGTMISNSDEGLVGKKAIDGYTFVETKPDQNGVRTHVYTKIVTDKPNDAPVVDKPVYEITRHVNPDGVEVAPNEEGHKDPLPDETEYKPDGSSSGRTYTNKSTTEDGITTHTYQLWVAPVDHLQ